MNYFYKLLTTTILASGTQYIQAQTVKKDTVKLDSVLIKESRNKQLPDVSGTFIYAGKKTNIIYAEPGKANLAGNVARTLFSQVPGINVWEMDGAGLQINIGTRGTDMHRSIETNMRQNGYATNSDAFGYPENHYNVPFQAIEQVQILRGSAALQFGPQFGGMYNFKLKEGDTTKALEFETEQSAGSNRFLNSYNAVGGKVGKVSYYAYFSARSGNGWRPDAAFNYHAYYANLKYQFNSKGSITFQFSRSDYVQQIAGGLTDAQYAVTSRQSNRFRNFFNPVINIPAVKFNYNFSADTRLEVMSNMVIGQRNSVQFIAPSNINDTLNTSLKTFNPRQVDRDYYNSIATEARVLHNYILGSLKSTLSAGVRFSDGITKRKQKGLGTTATDFDLTLTKDYGVDLRAHTQNYAVFIENIFRITHKLSVTPGARYENIETDLTGAIVNQTVPINYHATRSFPLFGTGLQYQVNNSSQIYGNISQAYRPYLYAAVTPADQLTVVDPNIKDTRGYDIDLGYRGHLSNVFNFDVNGFYVFYGNRPGTLNIKDAFNASHLYLTNIGDAVAKGFEAYTEVSLFRAFNAGAGSDLRLFSILAYTHGRYKTGSINNGGTNASLVGNYIEGTPEWTNRTGLTYLNHHITANLLVSYVGKNFSDANNTISNPTGATGIVPAYHVVDFAFNYSFLRLYHFNFNLNNVLNAKYFTRRINMYPGPGILPADGRSFNIGFGLKI